MKKKVFNTKLSLNKETISKLNQQQMNDVKGGVRFTVKQTDCEIGPYTNDCESGGHSCFPQVCNMQTIGGETCQLNCDNGSVV